jgi:hypothetical protein
MMAFALLVKSKQLAALVASQKGHHTFIESNYPQTALLPFYSSIAKFWQE